MVTTITPETALMVAGFDDSQLIKQSKGFQTFFARSNPNPTFVESSESFNYDIRRKGKKISELLSRKDASISLGTSNVPHTGSKWENVSYVFPNITETASADWNDTLKRRFNEAPYGDADSLQRRKLRLQMDLVDNANEGVEMIFGRLEKMSVESMTTGKITLDDTAASQYNFGRASGNTFAASAFWTVTTHNPLTDIDNLDEAIRQNGKTASDFIVMGEDSWVAFQNNTLIKASADIRNYHFIKLGDLASNYTLRPHVQWMQEAGFVLQGEARTPKGKTFPIFTYPEQYQNSSGTWIDYMSPKTVFMGDSTARLNRYFGPRLEMPATATQSRIMREALGIDVRTAINMPPLGAAGVADVRFFDWDFSIPSDQGQTGIYLRTSTNPLYIPTHIDAFGQITATVA